MSQETLFFVQALSMFWQNSKKWLNYWGTQNAYKHKKGRTVTKFPADFTEFKIAAVLPFTSATTGLPKAHMHVLYKRRKRWITFSTYTDKPVFLEHPLQCTTERAIVIENLFKQYNLPYTSEEDLPLLLATELRKLAWIKLAKQMNDLRRHRKRYMASAYGDRAMQLLAYRFVPDDIVHQLIRADAVGDLDALQWYVTAKEAVEKCTNNPDPVLLPEGVTYMGQAMRPSKALTQILLERNMVASRLASADSEEGTTDD